MIPWRNDVKNSCQADLNEILMSRTREWTRTLKSGWSLWAQSSLLLARWLLSLNSAVSGDSETLEVISGGQDRGQDTHDEAADDVGGHGET